MPSHCPTCGRPMPCERHPNVWADDLYDGLYDDVDGWDRNGAVDAAGNVHSDADPGL